MWLRQCAGDQGLCRQTILHAEFFGEHRPTTSMLEVKGLIDPDMLIEIDADTVC